MSLPFPPPPPEVGYLRSKAWKDFSFQERLRFSAKSFAVQGDSSRVGESGVYLFKATVYLWLFWRLCSYGRESEPVERTLLRFFCFNVLWEVAGLGTSSGPANGRYFPPVLTAFAHFIRFGTAKIPLLAGIANPDSFLASTRRNPLDVLLFGWFLHLLVALSFASSPEIDFSLLSQLLFVWAALGVSDQTVLLAARSDVYLPILVLFRASSDTKSFLEALKLSQLLAWEWSAISKLGQWWEYSCLSIISNSPWIPAGWKRNFVDEDGDRPSTLACDVAHIIRSFELVAPILIAFGGRLGTAGVFIILQVQGFLLLQLGSGTPVELSLQQLMILLSLNVSCTDDITTCTSSGVSFVSIDWKCNLVLVVFFMLAPCVWGMYPARLSHLFAHATVSGNYPVSVWLIRRAQAEKLDKLVTLTKLPPDQLRIVFKHPDLSSRYLYRVLANRVRSTLSARVLLRLIPLAVKGNLPLLDEYLIHEGDMMAQWLLGWNFNDGHLSGERLLSEVQARGEFEKMELMHLSIEPFPVLASNRNACTWTLRDEVGSVIETGSIDIKQVLDSIDL